MRVYDDIEQGSTVMVEVCEGRMVSLELVELSFISFIEISAIMIQHA